MKTAMFLLFLALVAAPGAAQDPPKPDSSCTTAIIYFDLVDGKHIWIPVIVCPEKRS